MNSLVRKCLLSVGPREIKFCIYLLPLGLLLVNIEAHMDTMHEMVRKEFGYILVVDWSLSYFCEVLCDLSYLIGSIH